MRSLKHSADANIMVFMTDAGDHITGKTGLSLSITLSKNGGAFGSISPSVTERGNGWYNVALTSSHTDTGGDVALHIEANGADPCDVLCYINSAYQAKVWIFRSTSVDHYQAVWFRGGEPVLSGISSSTIQIIKQSDGTDLIGQTGMTQIGSTGIYKYTASTKMVSGNAYAIVIQASIDGATRTWIQPAGYNV